MNLEIGEMKEKKKIKMIELELKDTLFLYIQEILYLTIDVTGALIGCLFKFQPIEMVRRYIAAVL